MGTTPLPEIVPDYGRVGGNAEKKIPLLTIDAFEDG